MKKEQHSEQPPNVKKVPNAGSGAFNQGAQQDEHYDEGVADGPDHPEQISKEPQNPKTKLPPADDKKDQ